MYDQNIIEPKNIPIWTVASMIVSILALTIGLVSLYRSSGAAVITGAQILLLNQKIETLSLQVTPKPPSALVKP